METYDPTIEDSYRKQVVLDGQPATLEVLDTAGQEEYTALRDQWIREGEGFLLVYSITSRSSFSRIRSFFNQIQRVKEDDDPFSVVIVGNKSDRGPEEREVSTQEGEALAEEMGGVPFFESSAKLNINIEAAFFECARQCKHLRAEAVQQTQQLQQLQQQQHQQQHQQHQQSELQQTQPAEETLTSTQQPAQPAQAKANATKNAAPVSKDGHGTTKSKKKHKKDKCVIM